MNHISLENFFEGEYNIPNVAERKDSKRKGTFRHATSQKLVDHDNVRIRVYDVRHALGALIRVFAGVSVLQLHRHVLHTSEVTRYSFGN
jgi:hypothetical protein